jgi:hypothetical protein
MEFEKTEVWGFEHAIRGMRNPMNSWGKTDSVCGAKVRGTGAPVGHKSIIKSFDNGFIEYAIIGENDLHLMQGLIKAGSEHRKFMRQIFVSVDITAPLYWWKEFDTYKVGTVSNSCSTMHKLASTPITIECFEMDDYENVEVGVQNFTISEYWSDYIECLESLRQKCNETKDKRYWKELIRLLPESWLQKRTITMDYENILNMYNQRCAHLHKLTEWSTIFKKWVEMLPYAKELLCIPLEKK